jgi:hypothetical protein
MKLTIIGEENVYEQEVSQSMDVQDVIALIAAEVSCPPSLHLFAQLTIRRTFLRIRSSSPPTRASRCRMLTGVSPAMVSPPTRRSS